MSTKARKPWLANLVWATALFFVFGPVLYVLSYAPCVRLLGGGFEVSSTPIGGGMTINRVEHWGDGRDYPAYQPVDWLIDNTPLQRPLFWWAGLFGVEPEFRLAAALRPGP
jgi:hypothetical protein